MDQQQHYVGLDALLETTAVCVIDDHGAVLWRGKCASTPDSVAAAVQAHAPAAVRVGLETRQLSNWLTLNLRRRHVPDVCLDARHAKAALSLQINKTDANDAFGLAQIVRTGWYREVAVKSMDAHTLKMLLSRAPSSSRSARKPPTRSAACSRPSAWSSRAAAKARFRSASASRSPAIKCWRRSSSRCSSAAILDSRSARRTSNH